MTTETKDSGGSKALEECDLIMKGGVTSGIVYPAAVLELMNSYSFRSIGGASAGAVAAAFTAAAEFNRDGGGFEKLRSVYEELQQPKNLLDLFQATPRTQPLLNLVLSLDDIGKGLKSIARKSAGFRKIFRKVSYACFARSQLKKIEVPGLAAGRSLGAGIGLVLALVLVGVVWLLTNSLGSVSPWQTVAELVVLAVLFAVIGYFAGELAAGLLGLYKAAFVEVPKNLFGICSGHSDNGRAVADWTYTSLQKIAGRGCTAREVLTFADLEKNAKKKSIELRLMTTNLSEERPYDVPFADPFIFRERDLSDLFHDDVVKALIGNARSIDGIKLPEGCHFLPAPLDFPVAFGARLSMSFPLFFSSVPLYALPLWARERIQPDPTQEPEARLAFEIPEGAPEERLARAGGERVFVFDDRDLVPHWFSDGGITSNFPIHFFDAWLPQRPTFGITLRYLPDYLDVANGSEDGRRSLDADEERALNLYLKSMLDSLPPNVGTSHASAQKQNLDSVENDAIRQYFAVTPMVQSAKPRREKLGRLVARRWASTGQKGAIAKLEMVELPGAEEEVPPEWRYIAIPGEKNPAAGAVPALLWSVIATMHDFRDDTQAALPGYRERVAQVRLGSNEGGFNLNMKRETIRNVVAKGEKAGAEFLTEFRMPHHQWVRLRLLVMEFKEKFGQLAKIGLVKPGTFPALVDDQMQAKSGFPYQKPDTKWCDEFLALLAALQQAVTQWGSLKQDVAFHTGEPPPVMRITPKM
jgi:predicted acylesterase/phospholipase RssA